MAYRKQRSRIEVQHIKLLISAAIVGNVLYEHDDQEDGVSSSSAEDGHLVSVT